MDGEPDQAAAARCELREGCVGSARRRLARVAESVLGGDMSGENRSVAGLRDLASLLVMTGHSDAACRVWEEAGRRGLPALVVESGCLEAALVAGEGAAALDRARVLFEQNPGNPCVLHLYAVALLQAEKTAEAFATWDRCRRVSAQIGCPLSTEPLQLALAMVEIERLLLETGDSLETAAGEGSEQGPSELAENASFGQVLQEAVRLTDAGRPDEALALLDACGDRFKPEEKREIAFALAEANGALGQWDAARRAIGRILDGAKMDPFVVSFYGEALAKAGDPEAALALLARVPREGPDDYFANYFSGVAHLAAEAEISAVAEISGEEALIQRLEALHAFRHAFGHYFFDAYHQLVLPQWEKALRLLGQTAATGSDSA